MILNSITQKHIEQFVAAPSHALALIAPDGAGKGYVAQNIAVQLLGEQSPYLTTLDVAEVKAGIDNIREIQKFLSLVVPGNAALKRIVIIEHVDLLGHEAQNALLKTLEEPPADSLIILTYAMPSSVLPTIASRVQTIRVLPISLAQATEFYGTGIERNYYLSNGYIGLLHGLTEKGDDHPLQIAMSKAKALIGQTRYQRMTAVDRISKDKECSPSQLVDALYRLLDATYHQAVKTKSREDLLKLSKRLQLVESALRDLQANTNAKLVLSRLFFEL